jgi:hypothetical protein
MRDERPDTGGDMAEALQLDPEETLTEGDPLDAGYSPPDRPYAVEDPAVVGEEETLDERLAREEPDEAGIEPVVDESPAEDPEVAESLEEERRPRAAERDAARDMARDMAQRAARIDEEPETGGVPGVAGSRDAGVTPGSWR